MEFIRARNRGLGILLPGQPDLCQPKLRYRWRAA